jgi:hypothetical protein
MKYLPLFIFSVAVIVASCGKGDSPGNNNVAPTNLTVNAIVSTDNSGNVSFTAAATNAVTYDYDYGNGVFQTVASGIVT